MPYLNEHAVRLHSPDRYVRFRRENDKFGKGIDVIWGITEDGKVEIQALRFDAEQFDIEQVRKWLREHGYEPQAIEPARKKFTEGEGDGEVEREAVLIRAGEYPDKGITLTEADLDRLAEQGTGAPVIVEHKPTLVLGWVRELWRKGKELWGKLVLKPHANALIEESPVRGLSVGLRIEEGGPILEEVSLTATPRIADARLFQQEPAFKPASLYIAQTNPPDLGVQEGLTKMAEQQVNQATATQVPEPTALEQALEQERARARALEQRVNELTQQVQFAQTLLVKQACAALVDHWRRKGKLTPASAKHAEVLLLTLAQQSEPHAIVQFSESRDITSLPPTIAQFIQFVETLPEQPIKRAVQFVSLADAEKEARKEELRDELRRLGFKSVEGEIPDTLIAALDRNNNGGWRE